METRFCALCGHEIPNHRNKNSKFCCDECYYDNKKSLSAFQNKKKILERELLKNDEIINDLYSGYLPNSYISASELLNRNFNWNIYSGEIEMNNIKVKKLIRYGYVLFVNQTIQIWKL